MSEKNELDGLRWIDSLLAKLVESDDAEDCSIDVTDPRRLADVRYVYETLIKHKNAGSKIFLKVNEPFDNMACIKIVGNHIRFRSEEALKAVFSRANNFEVCQKTDGTIVLSIMFYGMTREVKRG